MTPREFSGWVPAERQLHYDAEDNLTGYTVVERESRINDEDRFSLLGLARYENELCRCGYHPSVARNDDNDFTPDSQTCPVCAGQDTWNRVLAERDGKAVKHDAPAETPRPSDGRHSYMRLMPPATKTDEGR